MMKKLIAILSGLLMAGLLPAQSTVRWPADANQGGPHSGRDGLLPTTKAAVEEAIARLEVRLDEVRRKAGAPRHTPVVSTHLTATPDELSEQEQALQQWVIALDQQGRCLRRWQEVRRRNEDQAIERESWTGYSAAPTLVATEQLTDVVSAERLQLRSALMLLPVLEAELTRSLDRLGASRQRLRQANDEIESPGLAGARRTWLVGLAQLKHDADEAAVEAAGLARRVAWETVEGERRQMEFNERKLAAARAQTRITRADLDGVVAQIKEKRASLQADLNAAIAADRELQASRDTSPDAGRAGAPGAEPNRLADAEVAQARIETSAHKVEAFRAFLQLADQARSVWEDRLWATEGHGLNLLQARLRHHRQQLDGLRQWKVLIEQSLSAVSEQVLRHALRSEDGRLTPSERAAAKAMHAALQERAAIGLRMVGALVFTEDLSTRLCTEISEQIGRVSMRGRLGAWGARLAAVIGRIWQTELYIAEDSVIAGGQKVSLPRSITLGKVVIAATIFMAGLLAARLAYRLVRRMGETWLAGGAGAAEVQAKAVATAVALLSLLVAMASVRIPWTVFAFMGGALAIGVGFGAQTLINNFISGVILHCERSIRVGDIVEVEDQRGKVVRVGFRNSLVARGDGIEVLVPNSQFLEKKVVNWTLSDELVRYAVTAGVVHGSPPARVAALMAQAAAEHPHVIAKPPPIVLLEELGDHALVFNLQFWMRLRPGVDGGSVRSDLRLRIHHLLGEARISLAGPSRELHLDSSRPLEIRVASSSAVDGSVGRRPRLRDVPPARWPEPPARADHAPGVGG